MKLKFLLIGTSLSLIPSLLYAQCTTTPDCAAMGYKETANKGGCLKCPVGNGWYCPEPKEEKVVLGQCTGYAKNCKIADILNSDGTCTTNKENSKIPIGIVVYISSDTDKCGYAMTANPIATNITWSIGPANTGAFRSKDWSTAIKDFDVHGNMKHIIQAANGDSSKYPAAYAALNYVPSAAPTTKGKWALPTAGILNSLYTNLNAVNNAISKVGGTQLTGDNEHIWSSSEHSDYFTWYFCTHDGASQGGVLVYNSGDVVRPVIAF